MSQPHSSTLDFQGTQQPPDQLKNVLEKHQSRPNQAQSNATQINTRGGVPPQNDIGNMLLLSNSTPEEPSAQIHGSFGTKIY